MADRYLLESGSPDGYLLEDGSGVLLLDIVPPIGLSDNFDDNTIDAVKWATGQFHNGATTNGTVAETSQRLEITGLASTVGTNWNGYISQSTFDLSDKRVFVKLSLSGAQASTNETKLCFGPTNNTQYAALVSGTNLLLVEYPSGGGNNIFSVAYNSTNHAWLSLRHNSATDQIFLDVAPSTAADPPLDTDWTTLALCPRSGSVPITAGNVALQSGTWNTTATPITAAFDGFNTATTAGAAAYTLTCTTGAFALSGQAMTPAVAMAAATGTFSLSATATALAVTMPAATGVFALTGIATGLKVTMSAATGVFALTGNAAGLNKVGSSTLAATTGTFALTGYAAALARAARLSATTGVFALTGTNAAFPLTRRLTGLTGAFSLTGNAAVLAARFPAIAAQFVLSGFAAGGAVARHLTADPGSFVITGHDLAFIDFSPNAKTYPLAGIAQDYPGTAAAYPITTAQPYPQSSAQTYPLNGIPQQYPLAS